jgi:hypothetical protein
MTKYQKIYAKTIVKGIDVTKDIVSFDVKRALNNISYLTLSLYAQDEYCNFFLNDKAELYVYLDDRPIKIFTGYLCSGSIPVYAKKVIKLTFGDILIKLANKSVNIFDAEYGGAFSKALQTSAYEAIKFLVCNICKIPEENLIIREEAQLLTLEAPLAGVAQNAGIPSKSGEVKQDEETSRTLPWAWQETGAGYYAPIAEGLCGGQESLISKYATRYGLDPYFVAAICKVESTFNAKATNKNDNGTWDYGIMQVNVYYNQDRLTRRGWKIDTLPDGSLICEALLTAENCLDVGCEILAERAQRLIRDDPNYLKYLAIGYHLPADLEHILKNEPISSESERYAKLVLDAYKVLQTQMQAKTTSEFTPPIDFDNYEQTSDYGRRVINGVEDFHRGVDYGTPVGTEIKAPADGIITKAHIWNGGKEGEESYGNYIDFLCEAEAEYYFRFAHLSSFSQRITDWLENSNLQNPRFKKGEVLGYTGVSGLATGPHIHIEVGIGGLSKDNLVDPVKDPRSPLSENYQYYTNPPLSVTGATNEAIARMSTYALVDMTAQWEKSALEIFKELVSFGLWDFYGENEKIVLLRPDYFKSSSGEIDPVYIIPPVNVDYDSNIITDVYVTGNPFGEVQDVSETSIDIIRTQSIGKASIFTDPELREYFHKLEIKPPTKYLAVSKAVLRTPEQCEEYAKYLLKKSCKYYYSGTLSLVFNDLYKPFNVYTVKGIDFYFELAGIQYDISRKLTMTYNITMGRK